MIRANTLRHNYCKLVVYQISYSFWFTPCINQLTLCSLTPLIFQIENDNIFAKKFLTQFIKISQHLSWNKLFKTLIRILVCESILYSRCKKTSKSQCFYHRISIEWTSLCKETYPQYIAPEKNFHTTCWHDDLFTVFRGVCICFRIWKSKLAHSFLILLVYSTMMIFMSRDPPPPPLHPWILMPNP